MSWWQNKYLRYTLLVFVALLYLALGILKWHYIFNFWMGDQGLLIYRYSPLATASYNSSYSDPIRYFLLTPKWVSTFVFGNLFLLLNIAVVYLTYARKAYIQFTFLLFFVVSVLCVSALVFGFLTGTYQVIYPVISRVKELQQSPFTLLFLLAAFKMLPQRS